MTVCRQGYLTDNEVFFIFKDGSLVKPNQVRAVLLRCISRLNLNPSLYNTQSLHIGWASNLMKAGVPVEVIKHLSRWKSNAVYRYLRN